jgi:cytochrome oxidase Cu insertion factor (SCO1/SenC/PrrC family)
MPGMRSGLNLDNPVLAAAFRSALLHQGFAALLIFAVLALAWAAIREWRLGGAGGNLGSPARGLVVAGREPAWRMVLRVGFGIIWIFDGLLQAQPAMVVGLPSRVIQPTAAASPPWVRQLVNWAGTSWSYHPVQSATAAVWIQVGIGCWLLAARRGQWSRLAGLVSLGWGLVVWVFGESFGGIFAPGLTWLFGAPGAAGFYCVAGALIALPQRYWRAPWLGRGVLAALGLFFTGMAVLQAWPGRGFWQGRLHDRPGTLTGMIQSMSHTPQPGFLAGWVRGFGSFTAAHGFAVNLFAVVALALIGTTLLISAARPAVPTGHRQLLLVRLAVIGAVLLCLADWVLVEDFGIFGGLGTDPNSMIPMALVLVAGYLAVVPAAVRAPAAKTAGAMTAADAVPGPQVPVTAGTSGEPQLEAAEPDTAEPDTAEPDTAEPAPPAGWSRAWRGRLSPRRLAGAFGAADARTVAAIWALGVTIIGAFPLAAAAASRSADPIIAQAIAGSAATLNFQAPPFRLTDQYGRPVSLAGLHGKVVLLTFLDPVCTSDCPLIAQEFREADQVLGGNARNVALVAIVANPLYRAVAYTRAFDRQEHLTGLPNWHYLTGTLPQLQRVWHAYGITAQLTPGGGMIGHNDVAYVIDASGRTRTELDFNPGPGTTSTKSSFAVELSDAAERAMRQS